ncbi:regulatory protein DnrI [Streptomyces himastatinicus ATCC 53653]|uniref:Regulatory protein DnrI n=1 Tax=Streptomyces himastatinicus ATCC 53653 TaxID=457427 RepID=D9W8G2_9ACTN|nr:AfsR/SARP family transcriptional regulator [Streptomyces himastatinicus]EFL22669.1 regulatory protein DnrI [Streptomyces himastatinicus ATCC 53653]
MKFSVLGPIHVSFERMNVKPPAHKVRQILALLLLNDSYFVSISSLIRELWPIEPPKSAVTTVQTYIVQIRKLLARGLGTSPAEVSKRLLRTSGTSYGLNIPEGSLDLHEYRKWIAMAEAAAANGMDAEAVDAWRRAESLWRGEAIADVEHGPLLRAEAASLRQSQLSAKERRLDAQLRLGLHHVSLAELAGLVEAHPFEEGLHAKFMLAQYRSGHRGRALQVYHDLRRAMVRELGVEPSASVQRLLQEILASDGSLELAR